MARSATIAVAVLVVGCGSTDGSAGDAGAGDGSWWLPTGDGGSESGGEATTAGDAPSIEAGTDSSSGKDGTTGPGVPPFGGSSGGMGGAAGVAGMLEMANGVSYYLVVPAAYAAGTPTPLLVVFSGTEGGAQMTSNLQNLGPQTGTGGFIEAILDGVMYYGNGAAGATVLDDVRSKYDIDNDRTYLLGESAGTSAALQLGFHLKQSYFAAYWANDVNAQDTPAESASQLGFQPWGQAGPGGDLPDADAIVMAEQAAGYRLPNPAPYNGPGSTSHGDINQFIAAVSWFPGKTRP